MPRPYEFGAGGLTFFRGCAIIRSLRSQGSGTIIRDYKSIKDIRTKGFRGIIRDIRDITLPYNTTIIQ